MKEIYKKYLPSKKLIRIILYALALVVFVVLIVFAVRQANRNKYKENRLALLEQQTLQLRQLDSDGDGVYDWEESLWGTDKFNPSSFGGISDLEYVEGKRQEMQQEQAGSAEEYNATDKFAQEFFANYMALKEGNVDQASIEMFSNALGQKIADPNIINQYVIEDLTSIETISGEEYVTYYESLLNSFEKYKQEGIGDELEIVSGGLTVGRETEYKELEYVADAYKSFAKEIVSIAVPKSLIGIHLNIVNSANNTGIAVANMVKVASDPIVGVSGIAQYEKYSVELIDAVQELEAQFE